MKTTATEAGTTPSTSKTDTVLGLMRRSDGTTLEEIVGVTGWKPHSARAVLAGLRKKRHAIVREKTDGISRYRISQDAGE